MRACARRPIPQPQIRPEFRRCRVGPAPPSERPGPSGFRTYPFCPLGGRRRPESSPGGAADESAAE
eukprot:800191-Alexandrium_andersonii.AAC.1